MTDNRDVLAEQAAHWVVRRASGEMTAQERQQLAAWCEQSPAHTQALAREQAFWDALEPLRPMSAGHTIPPRRARRWPVWLGAMAASVLVLVSAVFVLQPPQGDYHSAVGEIRLVTLADGSTVTLNTDTAIRVQYGNDHRTLTLLRGEALFDVAPDRQRPFRVFAGGGYTQAIGTAFNIRSAGNEVRVGVTDGRVGVSSPDAERTLAVPVAKGYGVVYREGLPPGPVLRINTETVAAWTQGWVELNGLSLREALAELGRYMPGRLVLMGEPSQTQPVSGVFTVDRLDDALEAIAELHALKVSRVTPWLTVLH